MLKAKSSNLATFQLKELLSKVRRIDADMSEKVGRESTRIMDRLERQVLDSEIRILAKTEQTSALQCKNGNQELSKWVSEAHK